MIKRNNQDNGQKDMTNREMFSLLMGEMIDIRRELKGDIANLDRKFMGKFESLSSEFKILRADFHSLRSEVHQNMIMFMSHVDSSDKRLAILEAKVL